MKRDDKDLARKLKEMQARKDYDLDLLIEGARAGLDGLPPDLKKALQAVNLAIKSTALEQDLDYDSKKFKQIWILSLAIMDSFLVEVQEEGMVSPEAAEHLLNVMFAVGMI